MNLKTINLIGNIFLLLNLIVGLLHIHWAVIILFAIIHTVIRMMYLKAEQHAQANNPDVTKTNIAPPMIRNAASVISAVIMAGIIYAIGYGLRYGFNILVG